MRFFLILTLLISAFSINAQTAAEMRESLDFERQAVVSYNAKEYAKFLEQTKRASALKPNHPRLLYNLAVAYALNNKPDDALTVLERLAAMDLIFNDVEDLKPLHDLPRFKAVRKEFALNEKPVNRSEKAFTIPQKDLITEGIAYDAKTKRFFVSSIHRRKIVSIDKNGRVSDFSSDTDGLWSVSGMRVDEKRNVLWAATTAFPQMKDFIKADDGKSAIFKYDLKTGKLLQKFPLSNEKEKHALGDLVLAKNGDVYASDSVSPNIYRIDSKTNKLEIFLSSDNFASLQGLAFSPDEKFLFAADYSKGVFRVDLKDKKISQIAVDKNTNPIAIDGLYFHQDSLIVIQNGFRPHRVARFVLNKDFTRITKSETLEANHADFNEPTLGVLVENDLYYIANSQWNLTNERGTLAEDKLKEPVILRLKL